MDFNVAHGKHPDWLFQQYTFDDAAQITKELVNNPPEPGDLGKILTLLKDNQMRPQFSIPFDKAYWRMEEGEDLFAYPYSRDGDKFYNYFVCETDKHLRFFPMDPEGAINMGTFLGKIQRVYFHQQFPISFLNIYKAALPRHN